MNFSNISNSDGPTAVFIAGKIGTGFFWEPVIGGVITVIALFIIYRIYRKRKKK